MNAPATRIRIGNRVTIYRRGKRGVYCADFHYHGQHRRLSLKTPNRKVAQQRAVKLAAELEEGCFRLKASNTSVAARRCTLADGQVKFLEYLAAEGKRPKTLSKYAGTLNLFAEFASSSATYLDQLTLPLIDEFRRRRKTGEFGGKAVSAKQMYHDARLLKQFFQWCEDRKLLPENPLKGQKFSPPPPRVLGQVLTLADVNAILDAANERLHPVLAVLAFTGMRSGSCRNLLVEDVDLDGRWIYVRSREGAETKTGTNTKVPIHERLCEILASLPSRRPGGYFFTAPASKRYPAGDHHINTKHLNDDFTKILKRLGLPTGRESGFTIHSLRHFFKSFCVAHGVPREYVDAWQGHASVKSAADLYMHIYDQESQRLMSSVPFGDGAPAADAGK